MDSYNWRPNQGQGQAQSQAQSSDQSINSGDWRAQLQPDSRFRIVNKIMETMKRHLPFSGQEGLRELRKIAMRFEEKIYTAAMSQSDYLRKISLKMLTMESKSPNGVPNGMQSNSTNSKTPPDAGIIPRVRAILEIGSLREEGEGDLAEGEVRPLMMDFHALGRVPFVPEVAGGELDMGDAGELEVNAEHVVLDLDDQADQDEGDLEEDISSSYVQGAPLSAEDSEGNPQGEFSVDTANQTGDTDQVESREREKTPPLEIRKRQAEGVPEGEQVKKAKVEWDGPDGRVHMLNPLQARLYDAIRRQHPETFQGVRAMGLRAYSTALQELGMVLFDAMSLNLMDVESDEPFNDLLQACVDIEYRGFNLEWLKARIEEARHYRLQTVPLFKEVNELAERATELEAVVQVREAIAKELEVKAKKAMAEVEEAKAELQGMKEREMNMLADLQAFEEAKETWRVSGVLGEGLLAEFPEMPADYTTFCLG